MADELVLVEASLFQLRAAAASIDDPMFASQLQLTLGVLGNAVAGAAHALHSAAVNDIAFALNDVAATIDELSAADAASLHAPLAMLREDVARLQQLTALPDDVVRGIRALQTKLRTRASAIERQTYREEGTPEAPLPHPLEELRDDAMPLRASLTAAGYATPALDELLKGATELRLHAINAVVDELDVIVA